MFNVSKSQLVLFTLQLAALLHARLPINVILESMRLETSDKYLKKALNSIVNDVSQGEQLNIAMAKFPQVFDLPYRTMIKAGLESNTLEESMQSYGQFLSSEEIRSNELFKIFLTPILFFIMGVTAAVVLAKSILPSLLERFSTPETKPLIPKSTQALVDIVDYVEHHYLFLLVICIVVLNFPKIVIRFIPSAQYHWDKLKLSIIFFGKLYHYRLLYNYLSTLAGLINAKIPYPQSFYIAGTVGDSKYLQNISISIKNNIEDGISLRDSVDRYGDVFPVLVKQMIAYGLESGELGNLLYVASQYYFKLYQMKISILKAAVPPLTTLLSSLFLLWLMIAVYSPILKVGEAVRITSGFGG